MLKQDAILLANEKYKKDGRRHVIYNSHSVLGYFVDVWQLGYTVYKEIGNRKIQIKI